MRKRYKIVLSVDIVDPDEPYPASGSYTHLNKITGVAKLLATTGSWLRPGIIITLDKIVDKGYLNETEQVAPEQDSQKRNKT